MPHNHANYLALKNVLKQVKLEVKGDAIVRVASLFQWFDTVEDRFIAPKPSIPKITKIDDKELKKLRKGKK